MNKLFFLFFILLSACTANRDRFAEFNNQTEGHIFRAGEHALVKENYTEAIKNLEALEVQFPLGLHAEQAKLDSIYAYYQHEDFPLALEAAKRFIHLYPRGQHVDYAYYMQGVINFETGWNWVQRRLPYNRAQHDLLVFKQAFNDFDTLIRLFPRSIYKADAQKRIIYIRNTLAQNELEIAQFYLKKKAYAAAKERAVFITGYYPDTPQAVQAAHIIKKY